MRAKILLFAAMALGALLILAACNSNGGDGDGGGESTTTLGMSVTPSGKASPSPEVCPKIDDEVVQAVVALLDLEKSTYVSGEPIRLTLRLVNCADNPITLTFSDAQRYDFLAKERDGDEVWRWSGGATFEEVEGEETFQPSEQRLITETWDQTNNDGEAVKPGQYELTAESTGCDEALVSCGPSAVRFVEIAAP